MLLRIKNILLITSIKAYIPKSALGITLVSIIILAKWKTMLDACPMEVAAEPLRNFSLNFLSIKGYFNY